MVALLLPSLSDVAVAMLLLFLWSAAVNRATSKGPMLWPVLGIIPTVVANLPNIYQWATDSLSRAGGSFRFRGMWFGRCYGVVTVDPAAVEHVLKTRFANFPKGRYYRERFSDFLGDGIFNADGEAWRDQRRAATAEMHSARFAEHSAGLVAELVSRKLLVLLDSKAKDDSVVDLQDVFLRFTFDNICATALGVDPGCLEVGLPEVEFAGAFEQATELTLFRFVVPPFVWKIMKLLDVGTERRLRLALRVVHEFAERAVRERRALQAREGLGGRSDLLSRLMDRTEPRRFSDTFLKDFCVSFILAGRDTSSVALAWFFWLLHRHPRVERRILEELSSVVGAGSADAALSVEQLKKMDYLHAALTETLRLYPPVPTDFKEVLEDDVLPDGTEVRKGARVIFSMYSMARTEAVWGEDCGEFRPERWMRDGAFAEESQFRFPVFNGGPRLCVGKRFAYVQMKMVAAAMLARYRVEVAMAEEEVVPKMTTTLYMRSGLRVRVRRRESLLPTDRG
ncbi:cytochrome P450 86B1 [Iris pallida]|uniref:noroxomaritidine synthase n=1 Tax=Iris pallida TaxID=29817 RepID=A0AAX6EEM9_IRIPA|nr:cytochrome P450 86B1 [Iris pallida]